MGPVHPSESPDALSISNWTVIKQPEAADAPAAEAPGQRHKPSIDDLVSRFLENTKFRFGDRSVEVNEIHSILNTFRTGKTSKRDALSSIQVTLGSHEDLKEDLMSVLYHEDARWGDGDFDLEGPNQQPCPPFLQPAHEPQMRLPSISSTWHLDHQHSQAINPAVFCDHIGSNNYNQTNFREPNYAQYGENWSSLPGMPSSSVPYAHTNFPRQNQLTAPPMELWSTVSHQPAASYDGDMSFPLQPFGNNMQQSRLQGRSEKKDYNDFWAASDYLPKRAEPAPLTNHYHSPIASYGTPSPRFTSPKKGSLPHISPSVLGNPYTVPIGQPAIDMPPPKKRVRKESLTDAKHEEQADAQNAEVPSSVSAKSSSSHQEPHTKTNQKTSKAQAVGGPFIHSICGKSFATRSKVKQHHWGARMDDLQTTTGCWVKHKKPDVSWDAHPSCKDNGKPSRAAKNNPPRSMTKAKHPDHKAPMVPSMIASSDIIPGFPTLHALPQTVVEALSPRIPSQLTFNDTSPHHAHRHSSRNSLDNLPSFLSKVSRIDAPKPQARNDSVVSYLDAQALEAEHNAQLLPTWVDSSRNHSGGGLADGQSPATNKKISVENSGNEMQLRLGMTSSSYIEDNPSTPSISSQNVKRSRTTRQTSLLTDAEVESERE